ncbi:hypothetical protein, partial [uncultured Nocardioides sp.]|uniref:hypothetical protein n=1 Tax=uncultured Nocardioides sp. TaxID=198441 RepID=UPI0034161523
MMSSRVEASTASMEASGATSPRAFFVHVARAASMAAPKPARPSDPAKKVVRLTGEIPLAEFSRQSGVKLRDVLRKARQLGSAIERDGVLDVEIAQL